MMAKTPNGETLLEACGGETVAHALLVRMSNMYTQSMGAERKFKDGYNKPSFSSQNFGGRGTRTCASRSRSQRKEMRVVR